jgi:hypothetical protein
MFRPALNSWFRSLSKSRRASRPAARSNSVRFTLTQLEGRDVPSTVYGPSPVAPVVATLPAAVAPAAAPQPVANTRTADQTSPTFKVLQVIKLNTFVDTVRATGINGTTYSVSLTVPGGQFKPGDTITETPAPSKATYYMVISKTPLPGRPYGDVKLSRIVKWYNGKPTIRGLNYLVSLTAPKWWYDTIQVKDIVREVFPRADAAPSWRWGKWNPNPAVEDLLLNTGAGLPNLANGSITPIAGPTGDFNCYAYAAANGDLAKARALGWSGFLPNPSYVTKPGTGFRPGTSDFFDFFRKNGWVDNGRLPPPPKPGESYVILYGKPNGEMTHAAVWRSDGVYAKMGPGGTFKFASPAQMTGSLYGSPVMYLRRTNFLGF